MTRPSDAEINAVINEIVNRPGPRWPGMSYEDGIRNALDWVLGDEDNPLAQD